MAIEHFYDRLDEYLTAEQLKVNGATTDEIREMVNNQTLTHNLAEFQTSVGDILNNHLNIVASIIELREVLLTHRDTLRQKFESNLITPPPISILDSKHAPPAQPDQSSKIRASLGDPEAFGLTDEQYILSINELHLPIKAYNVLMRNGIRTVGDILKRDEDQLLGISRFGKDSVDAVLNSLGERGFIPKSPDS